MDLNIWIDQMYDHWLECVRCKMGTTGAVQSSELPLLEALTHQLARLENTPLMSR